jgi:hypothetical protein
MDMGDIVGRRTDAKSPGIGGASFYIQNFTDS